MNSALCGTKGIPALTVEHKPPSMGVTKTESLHPVDLLRLYLDPHGKSQPKEGVQHPSGRDWLKSCPFRLGSDF